VAELENPNGWWRTTAQRLLIDRQDKAALEPLRALAKESKSPLGRLHALWTLAGLSALSDQEILRAMEDSAAGLREHSIRLAELRLAESKPLVRALLERERDPDPRVRFQLALTLGEVPLKEAFDAVVRMTVRDAGDSWTRSALLSAAGQGAAEWVAALPRDFLERPAPGALELVRSLAQAVAAEGNERRVQAWLEMATTGERPRAWQREALSCLPALRRAGFPAERLLDTTKAWVTRAQEALADSERPLSERVEALGLLGLLAPSDFSSLVTPKEPQELQVAAIRATPNFRMPGNWANLTVPVRREVLSSLLRRLEGVNAVLERLEKGEIRPVELESFHRSELLRHPDAAARARAKALLAPKGSEEREDVLREITSKMSGLKGDRARGEKVYQTSCATCHRLAGQGTKVGPDLEGVLGRDRSALLVDILDPNRAMDPSYQVYVVRTVANETVNGILVTETPAGVTLRRAGGEESTIARRDIAEIKAWPASLMPEGIENNLKAQDFADLLEFLKPARQ
jgi:putative heme-binding domain-containing protein